MDLLNANSNERHEVGLNKSMEGVDNTLLSFGPKKPCFQEKEYSFEITGATVGRNCPSKFGLVNKAKVTFTIYDGDKQDKLEQSYYASNKKGSPFDNLVLTLTGRHVGKQFDLKDLLGIKGFVEIIHYQTEAGDVYDNVGQIRVVEEDLNEGVI